MAWGKIEKGFVKTMWFQYTKKLVMKLMYRFYVCILLQIVGKVLKLLNSFSFRKHTEFQTIEKNFGFDLVQFLVLYNMIFREKKNR